MSETEQVNPDEQAQQAEASETQAVEAAEAMEMTEAVEAAEKKTPGEEPIENPEETTTADDEQASVQDNEQETEGEPSAEAETAEADGEVDESQDAEPSAEATAEPKTEEVAKVETDHEQADELTTEADAEVEVEAAETQAEELPAENPVEQVSEDEPSTEPTAELETEEKPEVETAETDDESVVEVTAEPDTEVMAEDETAEAKELPAENPVEQVNEDELSAEPTAEAETEDAEVETEEEPETAAEPAGQAEPISPPVKPTATLEDKTSYPDEAGKPQTNRLPIMHILLLAHAVLLAIISLVILKGLFDGPQQSIANQETNQESVLTQQQELVVVADIADVADPESGDKPQNVTFAEAQQLFQEGYYDIALLAYRELITLSLSRPNEAITRELLRLRAGQCLSNLSQDTQANELFEALSKSPSPIIRATAEYHLALANLNRGRHMQARLQTYRALSSLNTAGQSGKFGLDCDHLIARSLTEKTLRYFNTDIVIPWQTQTTIDLFAGLGKAEIKSLLQSGWINTSTSIMGPQITPAQTVQPGPRWSIFSDPIALEELLGKISAATDCPIEWVDTPSAVRRRTVSLQLPSVTAYRAIELAAGMAGLIARFDGEKAFIYDPDSLTTIKQQQDLLASESISAWRRFFLRAKNDRRIPVGHLAVACIYESQGRTASAIREFKTVSSRFLGTPASSTALHRCAKLRIGIHDYSGARNDLLTLLDSDPSPSTDGQIYLDLGQATFRAGLFFEASDVFRRLYYRDLSPQSQSQACLGLARCFYQQNQLEQAIEWFFKYVKAKKDLSEQVPADVFLLLAKSNEGLTKTDEALVAYELTLASEPTESERTEALLGLARVHEFLAKPAKGIGALGKIRTDKITQADRLEMVILTSKMYRQMALPEKAIKAINNGAVDIADHQMQTDLKLELARCKLQQGKLAEAHLLLGELLTRMNPGPEAHQVALELASLCVQVNRPTQAVIITKGLLDRTDDLQLKKKALDVLGKAYLAMNDYEQAAAAFTGVYQDLAGAIE